MNNSYLTFAKYYDVLTQNINYSEIADYFYNILCNNDLKQGILLDLACGTGTMCELMHDKGYEVIGVDNSYDMLNIATQKRNKSNKDILYLCQDMDKLDLYGTIDACICSLDSINHVTDENIVKEIFSKVSLFLIPNGIFIFDVNTCYKHEEVLSNATFVYDCDEVYCVWQNSKCKDNTIDITLDIFANEEDESYYRYQEEFSERSYTQDEINSFIASAGFEILNQYDDYTTNEITSKTQRITYVLKNTNGINKES